MLAWRGGRRNGQRSPRGAPRGLALFTAVVVLAGCAGGDTPGTGGEGGGGATLAFATSREPRSFDPALGGGIIEQQFASLIFETLVRVKPGGTEIQPGLASAWRAGDDARSWRFTLRKGVRFIDGTPFDAAAVCANFERWYHFRGILQSPAMTSNWQGVFGGFATRDEPAAPAETLYRSCEAPTEHEAVLNLTKSSGVVLSALALPVFSIASPDALRRYEADKVTGKATDPKFEGTFATEHPIGTGPFKLERWTRQEKVDLVRNDDYWGEKPKLARIVFPTIPEPTARRQALESGEIDVYDVVDPGDLPLLQGGGFQVVRRPPFNVGTFGLNGGHAPLDKLEVRQAVAHAIDREALVKAKFPPGTQLADQLVPPALWGRAPDVRTYPHDPQKARQLLAAAGLTRPVLDIWYRTDYKSPIVVDPEGAVQAVKADLEEAGFGVQVHAVARVEYFEAGLAGRFHIWLDEVYGGWGDPDSFVGLFKDHPEVYGLANQDIADLIDRGAEEADQDRRKGIYERLNRALVDNVTVVPFVHVPVTLAATPKVRGIVAGPLPWDLSFMRTATK